MQLTQAAIDLIAKVESRVVSDTNRLRQAKVPFIAIITDGKKPAPQMKKAPQDLNRRKYYNCDKVDSKNLWDGQIHQRYSLTEDYFS